MLIKQKNFNLKETNVTPEKFFFSRRSVMKGILLAGLNATSISLSSNVFSKNFDNINRNLNYTVNREVTDEKFATTYNNYYEFGSSKNIHRAAQKLETNPWLFTIDGLVDKPFSIDIRDLYLKIGMFEERIYRHRCVEAWAMTIPWYGFQLSRLLDLCEPKSSAKFLKIETFFDKNIARGQKQSWYPWPYTETITLAEAYNQLAFLATGIYGKELPKQNGAPIRLVLPWKYGFKSIKSIRKITFTNSRPVSFWESLQPKEYGFWANVNPKVPHARWSQSTERLIGNDIKVVPTKIFNGYGSYVSDLYPKSSKDYGKFFF